MVQFLRSYVIYGGALVLLGLAQPVAAQTGSWQVSFGAQPLHVPGAWFSGLNADVATPATNGWSVVAEAGWARDDAPGDATGDINIYNVAAGPRWTFPGSRVQPFVHLLGGVEFTSADQNIGLSRTEDSDKAFMLEPGVGIYAPIGRAWGAVAQGDLRYVFFKEEVDEQFRLFFGLRFGR